MSDNVSGMNPVAKMGFVPRGIYDNMATYDFLDFVYYSGNTYVAKKLTVGNEPQENNEYWQIFAKGGIEDVGIQFQEAAERQNIQSGEDTPTLFGKIKKWFADLNNVAFTGSYNDLSNKPTIPTIGNGTLTIQKNGVNVQTFVANQDNNATANIIVPTSAADVGAVATSKVMTTAEQIDANTDASNVAGAVAVKSLKSDLTNSINQINSNLTNISTELSQKSQSLVNNINYEIGLTRTYQLEPNKTYLVTVFPYSDNNAIDNGFNLGIYFIFTAYSKGKVSIVIKLREETGLDVSVNENCVLSITSNYRYMHYSITQL